MKLISLLKATNGKNKYTAVFDNDGRKKTTHFGLAGADDYTLKHDKEQRDRYRQRHAKDLKTGDPTRAGYLSYYILWNKPTVAESLKDYKQRFNL